MVTINNPFDQNLKLNFSKDEFENLQVVYNTAIFRLKMNKGLGQK